MYERSAIVLERYFENLFGLNKPSNLLQNYKNYCELFEKFNNFQAANSEEFTALEEFQAAEATIEEIQAQEEKLYKKNAKYEYNRDLIFNDITQKPEEIEKCMQKIEADIAKVQNSLVDLRAKFVEAVINYNEKKSALSKCKKARRSAEAEYNAIFEVTKQNIGNIPEEFIANARAFLPDNDQEELVGIMLENGKDEKIPFNNSVVRSAVRVSYDIESRIMDAFLDVYAKTNKLIDELLEGAVSVEAHRKTIRNIQVKLDFLNAEKEYLVQFLDYERIMVIHGKRTHRNLMLEACDNFEVDVAQIDNLYTLLLKEITNKSTKKAYKELYNKSYLVDIEENDERFKKEKTKINLSTATIMNTNYWRIEGIKNIYTVFYKDVVEVFGKDLDEFEVPRQTEDTDSDEDDATIVNAETEEVVEQPVEVIEEVEPEPEIVIEQVSDDVPALPGMVEAIIENEKESQKSKTKANKKKEENIQVIEEEAEKVPSYIDVFDEIETEAELETVQAIEEIENVEEMAVEEPAKKKAKKVKRYTRKKVANKNVMATVVNKTEKVEDVFDEIEEEPDIFGEKYKDIEAKIAELDNLEDMDNIEDIEVEENVEEKANIQKIEEVEVEEPQKENVQEIEEIDEDMPYEEEEIPYEEEGSIFENIENEEYEELNLKKASKKASKSKKENKTNKKAGILKNIMKLNAKEKGKATAN